jgi:hypothetical protein
MKNKTSISLAEPPEGAYLQSDILTQTRKDFYGQIWTLKYRSWTVTLRGENVYTEDCLAYCFYTPSGEAKLSRIVPLDKEDISYNEMFRYFAWWVFSYDSKIIEVDLVGNEKVEEKPPVPNIKKLRGKRISRAVS